MAVRGVLKSCEMLVIDDFNSWFPCLYSISNFRNFFKFSFNVVASLFNSLSFVFSVIRQLVSVSITSGNI